MAWEEKYNHQVGCWRNKLLNFKCEKTIITGITGQKVEYLVGLLLNKGHEVQGIKREVTLFNK